MKPHKDNNTFIPPHKLYTLGEEIANSITHGLAAALSVFGAVLLVALAVRRSDLQDAVAFGIYGFTLILLYLASTLYHSIQNPRWKGIFQRFDHAAIFFLIAGSYTPFLWIGVRGTWALTFLGVIWIIAFLGAFYKTFFIERFQRLSVFGYILMGWLGVLAGQRMFAQLSEGVVFWIAAGGLFYMAGVVFAAWRSLPYSHTVWHFFVIGGSLCHYYAIWLLLPTA